MAFEDTSLALAPLELDGEDPMASLANLMDVMLVFSLGLLIAITSFWNMEIPKFDAVEMDDVELQEIQNAEEVVDESVSGSGYQDLGRVYQDPATGKMYIIADEVEKDTVDSTETPAETEE